MNKMQFALIFR